MKFKVGDKVRITDETIATKEDCELVLEITEINENDGTFKSVWPIQVLFPDGEYGRVYEREIELVTE